MERAAGDVAVNVMMEALANSDLGPQATPTSGAWSWSWPAQAGDVLTSLSAQIQSVSYGHTYDLFGPFEAFQQPPHGAISRVGS